MIDIEKGACNKGFIYLFGNPTERELSILKPCQMGCFFSNSINKAGDNTYILEPEYFLCFDGYVLNKNEIENKYKCKWENYLKENTFKKDFPEALRGGFCGVVADMHIKQLMLFVDQLGNRALYYYISSEKVYVSNRMDLLVKTLSKENGIVINDDGVENFLEFGYFHNDNTLVKGIKRVEPGTTIIIDMCSLTHRKRQYYVVPSHIVKADGCDKNHMISELDNAFRKTVKRQFEIDERINKRSVSELTGGLDSRMTTLISDYMGYKNQINVTCSPVDSLDYSIPREIANDFDHEHIMYKLDSFDWLDDYKKVLIENNWSSSFYVAAQKYGAYKGLDLEKMGFVHTGVLGDAIVSTFYPNEDYNYRKPTGKENAYSKKVNFKKRINPLFDTCEKMSFHVSGFLGINATYTFIQNYSEWVSPFLDVDFLNTVMSIPFEYRANHHIYLDWVETLYPHLADYGWEKWGGVKPVNANRDKAKKPEMSQEFINYLDDHVNNICLSVLKTLNVVNTMIPLRYLGFIKQFLMEGTIYEKCIAISLVESIRQVKDICDEGYVIL